MLAIADAASGHWAKTARDAAIALVAESKESTPSLGLQLLADLRTICGKRSAMTTEQILDALNDVEESPWGELVRGGSMNARALATRLKQYGVKSTTVRADGNVAKGYKQTRPARRLQAVLTGSVGRAT